MVCTDDLKIALVVIRIRSKWKARVSGFTVVELIAVLVVVGLIASAVSARVACGSFYDALVAFATTKILYASCRTDVS